MATLTSEEFYKKTHPNDPDGNDYEHWKSTSDVPSYSYLDDDYMAEIEQYKGTPYYDQLLNNPWLAGNQAQFSPNFWQSIGEGFGDMSARDSYNADLRSKRSQWLSEFLERMRQEEYNDPSNQAARMRAAGMNPDLTGNIEPGSAAENDQPMQDVPMQQPGEAAVKEVANFGISLLSNIMGMAQSMQSLSLGSQEVVSKELKNNQSAADFVIDQIVGTSHFNNIDDIDNITAEDLAENIIAASQKIDYSVYSPKTRKLLKKYYSQYQRDVVSGKSPLAVEALKADLRKRYAESNRDAAKAASTPGFDEDFSKFMVGYSKILGEAENRLHKKLLQSQESKAQYEKDFYGELDPSLQAGAENDTARASSTMAQQQSLMEGVYTDLYKYFKEQDNIFGSIGLMLLPLLRSMLSNFSFGFGRLGKDGNGGFGLKGFSF